ncbi:hypothetical protein [Pseudoduganella violacea]|uniref:VanZ family protein n=1 Tax=Pseudoduganella violacea TaxID=1715466 RepID=A0A7W5B7X5_9BURK|nr:hypothetical protein [Pseudoduganella violacea]MBB3118061.1 VanZ family protein [Pseudoduganella violacea]
MFLAAGLLLVAGCLVPNRWLPVRMPNDKLLHFGAFAVLGLLALRLAQGPAQALMGLAGLLVLGWAIECLQQLLPDRSFCWRDMAANAAGLAFAGLFALAYVSI